jgi:hypothetical protein
LGVINSEACRHDEDIADRSTSDQHVEFADENTIGNGGKGQVTGR